MKPSTSAKKASAQPTKSNRLPGTRRTRTIAVGVIGVIGAAMLVAGRQAPEATRSAARDASADQIVAEQYPAKKAGAKASADGSIPPAPFPAEMTGSVVAPEAVKTSGLSSPVTITGCLEQADETFRLKDTTGADAPKARSWKSGFLKKGSASIAVVDSAHRLKLPTHVGQRVSVTGLLVNREMQIRSLQRVAASCNQKS
jgi:hypothetical protein